MFSHLINVCPSVWPNDCLLNVKFIYIQPNKYGKKKSAYWLSILFIINAHNCQICQIYGHHKKKENISNLWRGKRRRVVLKFLNINWNWNKNIFIQKFTTRNWDQDFENAENKQKEFKKKEKICKSFFEAPQTFRDCVFFGRNLSVSKTN